MVWYPQNAHSALPANCSTGSSRNPSWCYRNRGKVFALRKASTCPHPCFTLSFLPFAPFSARPICTTLTPGTQFPPWWGKKKKNHLVSGLLGCSVLNLPSVILDARRAACPGLGCLMPLDPSLALLDSFFATALTSTYFECFWSSWLTWRCSKTGHLNAMFWRSRLRHAQ